MAISDNMGSPAQIANPLKLIRKRRVTGSSAALCKQGIGRGAVRGDLAVVRAHPRNFGFEQRDPFVQLTLRVRAEIFACKAGRRVSAGPGAIGFIH